MNSNYKEFDTFKKIFHLLTDKSSLKSSFKELIWKLQPYDDEEKKTQQDSFECLLKLFDEYSKNENCKKIINDLFYSNTIELKECVNCKNNSHGGGDSFFINNLYIQTDSSDTTQVQKLKNNDSKRQKITRVQELINNDAENQEYCNNCKQNNSCKIKKTFKNSPPYLIFNLNHFVYDRQYGKLKLIDNVILKIDEEINVPVVGIDQTSITYQNYKIYAIIIHKGNTLNSGHYYTYCKNKNTNKWYCFNDDKVTPKEFKDIEIFHSKSVSNDKEKPYLLFYKKSNIPSTIIPHNPIVNDHIDNLSDKFMKCPATPKAHQSSLKIINSPSVKDIDNLSDKFSKFSPSPKPKNKSKNFIASSPIHQFNPKLINSPSAKDIDRLTNQLSKCSASPKINELKINTNKIYKRKRTKNQCKKCQKFSHASEISKKCAFNKNNLLKKSNKPIADTSTKIVKKINKINNNNNRQENSNKRRCKKCNKTSHTTVYSKKCDFNKDNKNNLREKINNMKNIKIKPTEITDKSNNKLSKPIEITNKLNKKIIPKCRDCKEKGHYTKFSKKCKNNKENLREKSNDEIKKKLKEKRENQKKNKKLKKSNNNNNNNNNLKIKENTKKTRRGKRKSNEPKTMSTYCVKMGLNSIIRDDNDNNIKKHKKNILKLPTENKKPIKVAKRKKNNDSKTNENVDNNNNNNNDNNNYNKNQLIKETILSDVEELSLLFTEFTYLFHYFLHHEKNQLIDELSKQKSETLILNKYIAYLTILENRKKRTKDESYLDDVFKEYQKIRDDANFTRPYYKVDFRSQLLQFNLRQMATNFVTALTRNARPRVGKYLKVVKKIYNKKSRKKILDNLFFRNIKPTEPNDKNKIMDIFDNDLDFRQCKKKWYLFLNFFKKLSNIDGLNFPLSPIMKPGLKHIMYDTQSLWQMGRKLFPDDFEGTYNNQTKVPNFYPKIWNYFFNIKKKFRKKNFNNTISTNGITVSIHLNRENKIKEIQQPKKKIIRKSKKIVDINKEKNNEYYQDKDDYDDFNIFTCNDFSEDENDDDDDDNCQENNNNLSKKTFKKFTSAHPGQKLAYASITVNSIDDIGDKNKEIRYCLPRTKLLANTGYYTRMYIRKNMTKEPEKEKREIYDRYVKDFEDKYEKFLKEKGIEIDEYKEVNLKIHIPKKKNNVRFKVGGEVRLKV
ncbi:hypothetical protein HCN44_007036 [Aphidius gifuensis]|uniref:ubiquitinyl hydrolase 1 n=1 Tax=Aphidius gifuensis TaxID=684658 RepID=A0A835CUA8_APHGI|nr:hypothetical protein HCN44_007036 [Aphidius gifuensis]